MPEHNCTNPPVSQYLISTAPLRDAIAEILLAVTRYPELTDFGFGVWHERDLTPEEREAQFKVDRAKMFETRSLLQFIRARAWLQGQQKRQTTNCGGTSYGLKHVAAHYIGYVTNGIFIAAAVSVGFQIERERSNSPNVWLNISKSAWRYPRVGGRKRRWS